MEVRIKDNNGYVDADWTIEYGVMVVSPKVEKFEPKDGDVIFSGSSLISIFKEMTSDTSLAAYAALSKGKLKEEFEFWSASNIRPATEEEKKLLFDKLKEKGYEWDAEKKEVVKIKWKPKFDTIYYRPQLNVSQFRVTSVRWFNLKEDEELYQKGWVFQTNEDCAVFVDNLNQAIKGIKS